MKAKKTIQNIVKALVLIALGTLIILNNTGTYGFDKSWPIFFIVISTGVLIYNIKDIGGWLIGIVGLTFAAIKAFYPNVEKIASYFFPIILILLGSYFIYDQIKKPREIKKEDGSV